MNTTCFTKVPKTKVRLVSFFPPSAVAALLSVNVSTVWRLIESWRISPIYMKGGYTTRVPRLSLVLFLETCRTDSLAGNATKTNTRAEQLLSPEELAVILRVDVGIGQKGSYSGTLLINGGSHAFSGSFDLAGQAAKHISRAASQGGPLTVVMTLLSSSNSAPQITGTVSGTNDDVPWVATNLTADRSTNHLPSAEYTMLVPPDTNSAPTNSPGGDGYALITNHVGKATITGALADGTAFSQTVPVSQDGYVPIYANLYAGKGLLLGWINLDVTNTIGVSLTWIHPARTTGLYQNGFTNVLLTNQILLSPWTNPPAGIFAATNLSFLDTINDTNALMDCTVTISNNCKLGEVSGPTPLSGYINPKTGLLKVTIGSGANKTNGYGAILLDATNGGGYFLSKTNAQAIKLEP